MSQPSPLLPARQRAQALAAAGDLSGALTVLERAVELGKINLAEDDPEVVLTAHQLGALLHRADDPMAARRVLEQAYAAGQWRLGDTDPLVLTISHDLGVVAEELGNRHEARKAFGRVAALGPGTLGADHWAVTRARAYLGDHNPPPVRLEAVDDAAAPPPPHLDRQLAAPPSALPAETLRIGGTSPREPLHDAPREMPGEQAGEPLAAATPRDLQAGATPREHMTGELPRSQPPTIAASTPRSRSATPEVGEESAGSPAVAGALDEVTSTFEGISLGTRRQQVRAISDPSPQGWHTATDQPRGFDGMRDEHPTVALPVQQSTSAVYPHAFDAPVTPSPTPGPTAERIPYRRRGFGVFAAIAATLAAIIAVAALIFALATRSGSAGKEPDKPTLSGSPPGDVQLRDEGSRIEVSWTDPTHGTVSFLVAMGHPGEQLKPVGTLGPGQTSYQMSALNPALDYCFAVIAVYRKDRFATSRPACTERPTGGATPK